ncbi:MAG TPA: LLM class flavin-dependent oxidoreductase [Candidatus Bathyarchaeia archaeon]|nr:LLM class flavin-dependent oxidoreductase [Candidatus Bathyarchaeia archaeon]
MKFDLGILATQPVPEIVKQVQLAEALGFETVWMTDTHLVCRELWVTLTACALATKRIKLGPGVTVPHSRHASVTASAILTLDELAPGRIVLGMGTGGSSAQTMGLKLEQVGRAAALETMATNIRRLIRRESIRFESGTEGKVAWLEAPRSIPLYLAGSGPRMLASAGKLGDGVMMYVGTAPAILRAGLDCVARGAGTSGRRVDDLDVVLWTPTSISRDAVQARDHVRGRVASALRHPLPVELSSEDQAAVARIRGSYDAFQHATAASQHRTLVPDRLVNLMALAGTPEDVRAQVERVASVKGIDRIAILPQVPGEGFQQREQILRMFAESVMAQ